MSMVLNGFRDELEKLGGLTSFVRRLQKSPELRRSIMRGSLLGAGTGAASGLMDQRRDPIHGALVGALTGGATGTAFPAWFSRGNMRAADEVARRIR